MGKEKLTQINENTHILVCISPSYSNSKVIQTAARMANAFHESLIALYVETPENSNLSKEDKKRLDSNIELAKSLGAKFEIVHGDDIAFQIAQFARLTRTNKIVIGRSIIKRKHIFSKPTLVDRLISEVPNLDIYIIPIHFSQHYQYYIYKNTKTFDYLDILKSIGILIVMTIVGYIFKKLGFSEANIITVYILGVLITAVLTSNRFYSFMSSFFSIIIFNFFFTTPTFTLQVNDPGYIATFGIMFIAAFITSSLTNKIKQNAKQSAQVAYRTKILLETNQLLQKETNRNGIIQVTCIQLMKLLNRDIYFYPVETALLEPICYQSNIETIHHIDSNIALWVVENNQQAGASTNFFSNSDYLYLSVRANDKVYGVVVIHIADKPLDYFEKSVVLSILGESALALESEFAIQEKTKADLKAKNEELRANLLRSISHDLRTPLTSISGNAGILMTNGRQIDENKKIELYTNIYDDSLWLISLVENLLSVTRIEEGKMKLNMSIELLDEVIHEALQHVNRLANEHIITHHQHDEFIFVKVDARLIMQVIENIVDNAIKYTHVGSHIDIHTYYKNNYAIVEILDDGNGISDENKEHIFDMFYKGNMTVADSRRSLGLGLALCKSIINAHEGTIEVCDNTPRGCIIRFTLPLEEVNINES